MNTRDRVVFVLGLLCGMVIAGALAINMIARAPAVYGP